MVEEIATENGRISNFQGLVTLTLTILHTVVHHSSTSTYIPNFIKIETFCGRTGWPTYLRTDGHFRPTLLSRLKRVYIKKIEITSLSTYQRRRDACILKTNTYVYTESQTTYHVIDDNPKTARKQQAFDVYRQPNQIRCSGDAAGGWLRIEDETVQNEDDVGDVTEKACHVVQHHEPIQRADCTIQRLVTTTEQRHVSIEPSFFSNPATQTRIQFLIYQL